jgi:hypothetical protein
VLPELNEQVVRNLPLDSFTLETVLAICDNISLTSLTTYLNNASNPDPSLVLRTLLKTKYICIRKIKLSQEKLMQYDYPKDNLPSIDSVFSRRTPVTDAIREESVD